jgi:hypothetical protein
VVEGFRLTLPAGWERRPDPTISLLARPAGAPPPLFPKFYLAILKIPARGTMADSVRLSKKVYAAVWNIEDEKAVTVNGAQANRLILGENLGVARNRQVKYFIALGGKVLIASGQTDPDDLDRYLPLYEAMIRTITPTSP